MKKAFGFIIFIDVTDPNSLNSAREIYNKIEEDAIKDAIKILVTNKIDLEENRAFS